VKGGCGDVGKVQKGTNLGPNGGSELRTTVRSDGVWNTETGNPRGTESFCTCRGCGGGKGNSLWPSRGSINHGEDVGFPLRGRKGANNVNVDVGKTAGRDWDRNWRRGNMDIDFGFLTKNTLPSLAQRVRSLAIACHKKREETRRRVALMPGWPRVWMWSKICLRKEIGMRGRKVGVETSPRREMVGERGMAVMDKEGRVLRKGMEGQSCWAFATSR